MENTTHLACMGLEEQCNSRTQQSKFGQSLHSLVADRAIIKLRWWMMAASWQVRPLAPRRSENHCGWRKVSSAVAKSIVTDGMEIWNWAIQMLLMWLKAVLLKCDLWAGWKCTFSVIKLNLMNQNLWWWETDSLGDLGVHSSLRSAGLEDRVFPTW